MTSPSAKVVLGQLPALRELHAADADGDGVTTESERTAHAERLAPLIQLTFTRGRVPPGEQPIVPRMQQASSAARANDANTGWLQRGTQRVVELISSPDVPAHVAARALLAAMLRGALHSFAPGHGKTVGAYLIGWRATARHAAFLGLTATVTHTIGVFASRSPGAACWRSASPGGSCHARRPWSCCWPRSRSTRPRSGSCWSSRSALAWRSR